MRRFVPYALLSLPVVLAGSCGCTFPARGGMTVTSDVPEAQRTPLTERLRAQARRAPLCVAHRGDSGAFPENTLPAFAAAIEKGAPLVELDYRETADGVPFCLHDETLDRTTDAPTREGRRGLRLADLRASELRGLDAGSWKAPRFAGTPLPTLEQALEVIQPRGVTMIEHKAGQPERLVELLRRLRLVDEVIVQSFDWDFLEAVHELEPGITIAALGHGEVDAGRLAALGRTGAGIVHWSAKDLRFEDVERLSAAGYLLCVYTVDTDLGFAGAAGMGVDMVTTNRPARLLELTASGRIRR